MSWSVSEQGLLYIFEYSNGYKQAIRKSQISKVANNGGATINYNSTLSPYRTLATTSYLIQSYTAGRSSIDFTNLGGDSWEVGFKITVSDLPSGWSVTSYDYSVSIFQSGNLIPIESGNKITDYTVTSNLLNNGAGVYPLSCTYNMTDGVNTSFILIGYLIKVDASGNILGAIKNDGLKVNSVSGLSVNYTAYLTQVGVSEVVNIAAINGTTSAPTNLSTNLTDTITLPIGTGGVVVYTDLDNTFWDDIGSFLSNPVQLTGNFYSLTIS